MTRTRLTAVLLAQAAFLSPAPAQAFNASLLPPGDGTIRPAGGAAADAIASARSGVVHVEVEIRGERDFRIERPGSGVVVSVDGLIVTLDSLVQEAAGAADKQIVVVLQDPVKSRLVAQLVARDTSLGLALLKVEPSSDHPLSPVPLLVNPEPGDPAVVFGFPDGEDAIAFTGVVSESAGLIADTGGSREFPRGAILLTDAAIQRRCQGAALLSTKGDLIGLCDASRVREKVSEPTLEELKRSSFGFVIPAKLLLMAFGRDLASAPRAGEHPRSPGAAAVARVADAVVGVFGGSAEPPPIGADDPYARQRRSGVGSGVVVDGQGLVLTNRHLVNGAERIRVTLRSGESFSAVILASDASTNSALLRVTLPAGRSLRAVPLAESARIAVGAPVLAIGNPEGIGLIVGDGVVSARRGDSIQFDAPAGNQNGGGALITFDGELIGIIDGGVADKIDAAFAHRGDQAKVETSLNLAPGTDRLLAVYGEKLAGARRTEPAAGAASPVAEVVARAGIAMLNVYVEITTKAADEEDNPFASSAPRTFVEGMGSGVVIDGSGLALTNWHVVDSATDPDGSTLPDRVVRVARRDGRVFPVTVLSISREEDLALLQLQLEPGESIPAVELGSSSILEVGDATIAIGNPFGRANTVTAGVVSAKNQSIRVKGRWAKLPHLLETDAAINAGNSGGALLDGAGRLIGINSAGGSSHSVTGFAIAVDHVRERVHSLLLSPEKLRSPYLGLTVVDREGAVFAQSVLPESPAARAGIQSGDRVRSFGGKEVEWSVGLALELLRSTPGRPLSIALEREGRTTTVEATPWSAAQWAVCRQTGLLVGAVDYRTDPKRVHRVAVDFYRAFVGDPDAAPTSIPEHLVRVEAAIPVLGIANEGVAVGDFLLGIQLEIDHDTGAAGELIRFETIEDLQRCIDGNGVYEGGVFTAWIARGDEVRKIELTAKRLIL